MSKLTVEELQVLSVNNLRKYIKELDGEDKVLAESVLNTKLKRNEQVAEDPKVAAEIEASREAAEAEGIASADVRKAAREEALRIKEEEKAKIIAEKEALKEQREKLRAEAEEAKAKQQAAKDAEKLLKEKERIEAQAKRLEAIELKKAEAAAIAVSKEKEKELASAEEEARIEKVREKLREVNAENPEMSKTDVVRQCMAEGMTNSEMSKATGYGIKFICDTVWRIKRDLERVELREKIRAQMAAEKAGTPTPTEAGVEVEK